MDMRENDVNKATSRDEITGGDNPGSKSDKAGAGTQSVSRALAVPFDDSFSRSRLSDVVTKSVVRPEPPWRPDLASTSADALGGSAVVDVTRSR